MTVDIDHDLCMGCGACAELCPDAFEMDERTGLARVIVFEIFEKGCVEEAAATCPAECIYLKD